MVKLVEAARDGQPLEDARSIIVALLCRSDGNDTVDAERTGHILDGFGFAGARRACWRASEVHPEFLRESDVALVG